MQLRTAVAAVTLVLTVPIGAGQAASPDQSEAELARSLQRCAPETYEAALDCLDRLLPADVQGRLAAPGGATEAHFGLGMWLRNNWGLWRPGALHLSMSRLGFEHPDDMSAAILDGFAARERGEAFDVTTNAAESRSEASRRWDQAVTEGRAGTVECRMPERASLEQATAAIRACADRFTEGDHD